MRELVRTNDPVLVSAIEALLNGAEIHHVVLDGNMSVLEGSLGILPRRILVDDEYAVEARKLLEDAGLGHELRPDQGLMGTGRIADDVSEDAVLGGRLRLRQPRRGHRVGHDAILLAAACPARAGDAVVDLGAGVGAAGLALAARVPGVAVTLVEIDRSLAALAEENAQLNGLSERVRSLALDVAAPARAFAAAGLRADLLAHVLMNPPFNDPARQRASPDRARRLAHMAPPATLAAWTRTAARLLRPRGTLCLIWRADGLGDVLAALAPAFGAVTVLPVHGKPESRNPRKPTRGFIQLGFNEVRICARGDSQPRTSQKPLNSSFPPAQRRRREWRFPTIFANGL